MDPHNALARLASSPYRLPDPGASGAIVANDQLLHCAMTSAAAETRSLKDPKFLGQRLTLSMLVDGGDITVTAESPVNQTGNNTIVFGDAKDSIDFYSVDDGAGGFEWRVAQNDGTALSTV